MDMIEFTILTFGIKGVGFYGQTLAALIAALVIFMLFKRRA